MSQSSRSRALAHVRWREQVARLLAAVYLRSNPCTRCNSRGGHDIEGGWAWCNACNGRTPATIVEALLGNTADAVACGVRLPITFDVAKAREYAHRLLAEGERLEQERAVFADWTREKHGRGPEVDPWAFGSSECGVCLGTGHEGFGRQGTRRFNGATCSQCRGKKIVPNGWPGPLAREWGWEQCKDCEGRGAFVEREWVPMEFSLIQGAHGDLVRVPSADGDGLWRVVSRERCESCRGHGRTRIKGRNSAAANGGAALIRQGRRLLAAIEGQPSECRRCLSNGYVLGRPGAGDEWIPDMTRTQCPDCHGTGHNLSGTLPQVEHSAAARRKGRDGAEAAGDHNRQRAESTQTLYEAGRDHGWTYLAPHRENESGEDWTTWTRTRPRGEHRHSAPDTGPNGRPLRDIVMGEHVVTQATIRLEDEHDLADAHVRAYLLTRLPRWRRGELRHSEQRRKRERRRLTAAYLGGPGEWRTEIVTLDENGREVSREPATITPFGVHDLGNGEVSRSYTITTDGPLPRAGVD